MSISVVFIIPHVMLYNKNLINKIDLSNLNCDLNTFILLIYYDWFSFEFFESRKLFHSKTKSIQGDQRSNPQ
jgi:hypothetical protein